MSMAFSFQKAIAWTHTRDLSDSSPSPSIAHEVGMDVGMCVKPGSEGTGEQFAKQPRAA